MLTRLCCALTCLWLIGCGSDRKASPVEEASRPRPVADPAKTDPAKTDSVGADSAKADPELAREQEEYVEDVMAFSHTTHDAVRARMKKGSEPLKDEWNTWEKQGPMTPDRITAFYKQTSNYIYELA